MDHLAALSELNREAHIVRQAGAIPFRRGPEGLRVLLITSRDTGRWVIPKGHVETGQTAAIAAAVEAYEEAGLVGVMSDFPLGFYTYGKRLRSGGLTTVAFVLALVIGLWAKFGLKTF